MLYEQYTIGGELMHSSKGVEWKSHRYIDKVKTKNGKYRYIYKNPSSKYLRKAAGNSADNAANKTTINQINQRYEYLRKKDPIGADQYLKSMANKYKGTRIGEWVNNKFASTLGSEKPKISLDQEKANYEITKGQKNVQDHYWDRKEKELKRVSEEQDKNFVKVETVTKPSDYDRITNKINQTEKDIDKAIEEHEEKRKQNSKIHEETRQKIENDIERDEKILNKMERVMNPIVDSILEKMEKKQKKKKKK